MTMFGPLPQAGQEEKVTLDVFTLRVVPGTYKVVEAERFGEKISIGTLKYGDFNPYENAHAVSGFLGGYGLRRYSDPSSAPQSAYGALGAQVSQEAYNSYYKEAFDIDCSRGPAILAPLQTIETTGFTNIPVWMGEVTPTTGPLTGLTQFVAVAGNRIAYRNSNGTWTNSGPILPNAARKGAVGVYNGALIIGFGSLAAAVYTTDLTNLLQVTNTALQPIWAYAITADQAALFIAGGPSASNWNTVTSGLSPVLLDTYLTVCDTTDSFITALAPGGGVGIVFVGKTDCLGMIDVNGVFRKLVPFDSTYSFNCVGMRWALGSGGEEQRGALVLVFPRDRSLWIYQPSGTNPGTAENISVWARQGFRPQNIRGRTTCIQGTARWLYHCIQNGTSQNTWLLKRDMLSGAIHSQNDLGIARSDSMGITSLFGTNPLLIIARGSDVVSLILPLDGESPLDDANTRFQPMGTLDIPDIDLGFPDEQKIPFTIRVVGDSLTPAAQQIEVWTALDGGSYTKLGVVENTPGGTVSFPSTSIANRISVRFILKTIDPALTPQLLGFSVRVSINAKLYRIWTFNAYLPGIHHQNLTEDRRNSKKIIDALWAARITGLPVDFEDRWRDQWTVRILKVSEVETITEVDRTPETSMELTLLEFARGESGTKWDDPLAIWDDPTSLWGPGGP